MATGKTVPQNAGGAEAILSLLQALGGTKATSTTSANTAPLQQVLKQLQGQDFSQVLQQVFQQASAQIPRLQAAYGNASGGRSGNNSAAAAALEKLLASTTTAATSELAKLQLANTQQQIQAGQGIANGSQKVTQTQGTNNSKAARALAMLQMGSKVAPQLKKLGQQVGLLDPDVATSAGVYNPSVGFGQNTQGTGLMNFDLGGGGPGMPTLEGSFGGGMDFGDFGNFDLGSAGAGGGFDLGQIDFAGAAGGFDPFAGIEFGNSLDVGGFGNQFDFSNPGSFLSGNVDAGSLPDMISGGLDLLGKTQPYLGALQYIADPSKLGDAFELGEGNVMGDISQLAGAGSALGGAAAAAGLGSLPGLSFLGPLGAFTGFIAAMTSEPSERERIGMTLNKVFNEGSAYDGTYRSASNVDKLVAASRVVKAGDKTSDFMAMLPQQLQDLGRQTRDNYNTDVKTKDWKTARNNTLQAQAYKLIPEEYRTTNDALAALTSRDYRKPSGRGGMNIEAQERAYYNDLVKRATDYGFDMDKLTAAEKEYYGGRENTVLDQYQEAFEWMNPKVEPSIFGGRR